MREFLMRECESLVAGRRYPADGARMFAKQAVSGEVMWSLGSQVEAVGGGFDGVGSDGWYGC